MGPKRFFSLDTIQTHSIIPPTQVHLDPFLGVNLGGGSCSCCSCYVMFDDVHIDIVNLHKHLGIYLSSSLNWDKQVDEVCLKANRKLSVLRSVKLLSRQTLDVLYKLTVRSFIDYTLPVYCNILTISQYHV